MAMVPAGVRWGGNPVTPYPEGITGWGGYHPAPPRRPTAPGLENSALYDTIAWGRRRLPLARRHRGQIEAHKAGRGRARMLVALLGYQRRKANCGSPGSFRGGFLNEPA